MEIIRVYTEHLGIVSSELPTLFLSGYEMLGDKFEINTHYEVESNFLTDLV